MVHTQIYISTCGTYLEAGGGGGRSAEVDIHVVP